MSIEMVFNARWGKVIRWEYVVNPTVNNTKLTAEEDNLLFDLFDTHGNKWKFLGKSLNGRTDNFIKNRYYSQVKVFLRRLNKMSNQSKTVKAMASLKPSTLTKIFEIAKNSNYPSQSNFKEFFLNILSLKNHRASTLSEELVKQSNTFIQEIFLLDEQLTQNKQNKTQRRKRINKISKPSKNKALMTKSINKPELNDKKAENTKIVSKISIESQTEHTIKLDFRNLNCYLLNKSFFGSFSSEICFNRVSFNKFEDSSIYQDFGKEINHKKEQAIILNKEILEGNTKSENEEKLDSIFFFD